MTKEQKLEPTVTPKLPATVKLIHRDYSIAGGAVSLAIFDDRVEVGSAGTYPNGITPEMLTREHLSVQRNPLIADVFYRTGLIERWGRGTNRVAQMCREAGISAPEFTSQGPSAVVTFRANVAGRQPGEGQVTPQVTPQVLQVLATAGQACSFGTLQKAAGLKDRVHFLRAYLEPLLVAGWLERTIPEKPRSPRQRYRCTAAGAGVLEKRGKR